MIAYTIHDIAENVGIMLLQMLITQFLKNIIQVRKISARWIPAMLRDDQKCALYILILNAKQLLNILTNFNQRQFSNIVAGDKTCVNYFKPVRNIGNKIWQTRCGKML